MGIPRAASNTSISGPITPLTTFPPISYNSHSLAAVPPKPGLKLKNEGLSKQWQKRLFTQNTIGAKYPFPPPHFCCFLAFFALFFPLTALFSYKNGPFFPLSRLFAAASRLPCLKYTQAGYPPSLFSGGRLWRQHTGKAGNCE
jgi:hypothetical protein